MRSIIDSFSRCLGTNHQRDSAASSNDTRRRRSINSSLPKGASAEDQDLAYIHQGVTSISPNTHSSACCGLPLQDYQENMMDIDRSHAALLAHARRKATSSSNRRSKSKPDGSSSASRRSSLEKARRKSYKRKQDIFRRMPEPDSTFSNFFMSTTPFPQILCFANPIVDSVDGDSQLQRADDFTVDDETITSTLYFDARYEHLVENQQPIPLYQEFSIMKTESDNDIMQMFYRQSNKSIQSVSFGDPPPPPEQTASVMDDTSSSEGSSDESDRALFYQPKFLEDQLDDTPNASCMPSPTMCKSRNELDVIEDLMKRGDAPPGLRLISRSSNSSTAITPVCSSKSNNSQKSTLKYLKTQPNNERSAKPVSAGEDSRSSKR
mmetsp:Transcript_15518/g.29273  ORF Transcript_15518/g.29273 Transcript_15518/m.29273 type:complete len:379 (+) Transcript_15518:436-1572(+)